MARPEVENVAFACPGLGDGSTEFLLSVLDVRFPIEDLDEVEVAIVWLLKKETHFFLLFFIIIIIIMKLKLQLFNF